MEPQAQFRLAQHNPSVIRLEDVGQEPGDGVGGRVIFCEQLLSSHFSRSLLKVHHSQSRGLTSVLNALEKNC